MRSQRSRWAPHYSAICAISSERLVANWLLKNPEERFDARFFIQFLDERLLPPMNRFNGENPRSGYLPECIPDKWARISHGL